MTDPCGHDFSVGDTERNQDAKDVFKIVSGMCVVQRFFRQIHCTKLRIIVKLLNGSLTVGSQQFLLQCLPCLFSADERFNAHAVIFGKSTDGFGKVGGLFFG